ncbi:DUF2188 domain-containing protein [Jiangella asiatica]|uniref:DUF2188 domain-containing protein n=1 Tax=Jiangella asiatica TaxID=2530372 RepID=A0A4R5DEC2_9ACTN|nr:DUF2188 domain-containing protein [Jiangella asiatica]TDE11437.1 DUF2188 domain-containing protein [Jiangella asiatica]
MATGDIHTVPRGDEWVNIVEGDETPLSSATTQDEAAASGRQYARERGVEHRVHHADRTIGDRSTYPRGRDPRDIPG